MMIVIEGIDATGKSTLAVYLKALLEAKCVEAVIQESEGPSSSPDDLAFRLQRYRQLQRECRQDGKALIFVRHPFVSEPLYANFVHRREPHVDPAQMAQFYDDSHLFIYCEPPAHPVHHVLKSSDTAEFLENLEAGRAGLLIGYRQWALARATIVYRIGDDLLKIGRMCIA